MPATLPADGDEFAAETVCPMCGSDAEDTYEIEPGLEPVCATCAAEYRLDMTEGEEAARFSEETERPNELVDPGARNHPSDCDCPTCEPPEQKQQVEGFQKFMDRLALDEGRRGVRVMNDSPHRLRAIREQERPMGRTRLGGR